MKKTDFSYRWYWSLQVQKKIIDELVEKYELFISLSSGDYIQEFVDLGDSYLV